MSAEPPTGIKLRRATAADADAIGRVFDAAVSAGWTYLGDLARQPMFTSEDWAKLVADHQPPNILLVASAAEGEIVGYCAAHPKDGELFVLFVDPAHAGRGIGRSLLDAAHEALHSSGCDEAFLYVHERNERALAVYAAAGYHPDGSARDSEFRGTPIRELRLVKRLAPAQSSDPRRPNSTPEGSGEKTHPG
jgi:ribosomal protein S18 acetylase RimI-like enzyme